LVKYNLSPQTAPNTWEPKSSIFFYYYYYYYYSESEFPEYYNHL